MRKTFIPLFSVVAAATVGLLPIVTSAQDPAPVPTKSKIDFEKEIVPIVKASCLGCHNKDNAKHNVAFPDKMTLEDARKNPRLWTRAAREVKNLQMPPRNVSTMSDKERKTFLTWVNDIFPKPTPKPAPTTPPPTTGGGTGGN